MAIQYVGGQVGSFAGKTGSTTVNFALTGGLASVPAAGDLVIVAYSVGSTVDRALTIQNASAVNYTLAGAELYQNDTFDSNLRVAYRFMPGTPETSMVLSGTGSTADAGAYTIHVFRGVDATAPLDVAAVTAGNINTRLPNPGAITPTTAGAWIYVAGAGAGGTGGTYTASYLTDFRATNSVDTNDAMIGSGYVTWTSGAYDPAVFTGGGTDTANDSWNAVTLALRPVTATPYTAELTAPSLAMSGQSLTRLNAFAAQLSSAAVAMAGQAMTRLNAYAAQLSSPAIAMAAQTLNAGVMFTAELTAASIGISPLAVAYLAKFVAQLSSASMGLAGQALTRFNAFAAALTAASVSLAGQACELVEEVVEVVYDHGCEKASLMIRRRRDRRR